MKKFIFCLLPLMMGNLCHAEDITVRYSGMKAKVQQQTKDSVLVTVDGANVNIESLYKDHKITLLLTGQSDNGQLTLKTAGKAKVKLDNLTLTSQEGAPLCLKNKKKVEVVAVKGTKNTLAITACNDTANNKAATIWAKDKLLLSGKGTLIDSVTIPFSIRQSASIVSNPRFKVGGSYSVRTKDYERAFTISQQFTTVR